MEGTTSFKCHLPATCRSSLLLFYLLNFVGPFSPCFALDPMLMQSRLKWALPVLLPALSLSIASSASSYSSGTC